MNLLALYHQLPYPLKVIAASARGFALSRWRYSASTEQLVQAALERETWPAEKIRAYQQEQLAKILDLAAKNVPYYRHAWELRRRNGDHASWEILTNWPVLHKSTVREQPRAFLSDKHGINTLFAEHTSGTTGTPLTFFQSREALISWYALVEARSRRWYGVDRSTRWAILGGQTVTSINAQKPPYWVWNQAFSQLYLSTYHISHRTVSAYVDALRNHRIEYLYGYTSAVENLAALIQETGADVPQLKVIVTNAEPLFEHQAQRIRSVFGCPVRNSYGLSEQVCGASECDAGSLHLWPEAGLVEVLGEEEDRTLLNGQTGRMIATGLLNPAMPLIRYEVGDRGSLADKACACGRSLPILQSIEGRMDDVILTRDGRRIGRLDPVFKADLPIREAQIIQESLDCIQVMFVPAAGLRQSHIKDLERRLTDRLGEMEIRLTSVDSIPRGPNGKFRAVISKLH